MRAREPDRTGIVVRDGVRLAYEVFGDAPHTVLLMPTWSIIPSRSWKAQVPYLARRWRVVTFDGRGSGASDRPVGVDAYTDEEFVADALAVLAATRRGPDDGLPVAVVGFSCGVPWSLALAHEHPALVAGVVAISPALGLVPGLPEREEVGFLDESIEPEDDRPGWHLYRREAWLHGDYDAFLRFFFERVFTEPHSTKQIEDCVAWGREIPPERLVETELARTVCRDPAFAAEVTQVEAPLLVIHGDDDHVRPYGEGVALAGATGGSLVTIEGGGHGVHARWPVAVNRALGTFLQGLWPQDVPPVPVRARPRPRRPRALFLTSPIGLGHTRRDLAIADDLRARRPGIALEWLTQEPAASVLRAAGERVHPASAALASECAHVEREAREHDLHAFSAIRRMDEIMVANFGIFDEVVNAERYDLVIGDEAWEVDHHLHENPARKRFAFAWLTDFVGWVPMPDGGAAEGALTADYNAEMLEHRATLPEVRDASLFVGNPEDVVSQPFGPGLPDIRAWTTENFSFTGYVTGFDRIGHAARLAVRRELGLAEHDRLCVVTTGGSSVGESLLRRVLDAVPRIRHADPGLRLLVVCGPRIDPASLPRRDGVRTTGFVADLPRFLGAADVALVQGGLTTCMELAAHRVPFVFVPLRHHFEQNVHVAHRLAQYDAGRRLAYEDACDPDLLAEALLTELGRTRAGRSVETDGAARAGTLLASLL